MFEIEKKALLTPAEYGSLGDKILGLGGNDLGENNTDTIFYLTEEEMVKVQINTSKNTAKIAWKSGGADGATMRKEVELPFAPEDKNSAVNLVENMLDKYQKFPTSQQRHDYVMLNGLNLAVKYSDDYGYHLEIDKNVTSDSEKSTALNEIDKLAATLGVKLLSEGEEKKFVTKAIKKRGK